MLSGNPVEHSASLRGKDTWVKLEVVSLLVLLYKFELLQLLQPPSDDLGRRVVVELGSDFASVEAAVEVREQSDSGVRAQVDFASEGGDSGVDPVVVERSQLVP